jgi:CPA1 family monovalent cation:H+ antiporter
MEYIRIEQLELILLIGAIVAILARRLRIPYTVGLVVAGIAATFLPIQIEAPLSKDLLFSVLLPPLIFEAALYIRWKDVQRDRVVISVFATGGFLVSAAVAAAFMHFGIGWSWQAAILFGTLIAATDPVSVIATFRKSKVKGRLAFLVEAESLFNDATAAVAFTVALAFAGGEAPAPGQVIEKFVALVAGGIVIGLIVGAGTLFLAGATSDHLGELALSTIAAFGSFWLAEHFHFSGILATLAAGLLFGNTRTLGYVSTKGDQSMETFWEFAAFVTNTIIFVLLGVHAAYQDFGRALVPIIVATTGVIFGRALVIYPISALFSRSSLKIDPKHQHVLFWGGLRGALALALALGIPENLPYRGEIILVTFGVVAFSVFVQGLTMKPLLKRLDLLPDAETRATGG